MRKPNILALALLLFFCTVATAQEVSSSKENQLSLTEFFSKKEQFSATQQEENYYLHLRFTQVPTKETRRRLAEQNIQLFAYKAKHTYLATIPANIRPEQLEGLGIDGIVMPASSDKLSTALKNKQTPDWASADEGKMDIAINFLSGTSLNAIDRLLIDFDVEELEPRRNKGTLVIGRIAENQLENFSSQAIVKALDFKQEADQPLNFENRNVQRVNALQCNIPGAINLRGHGVVIGVGDGGELGEHTDMLGRINNQASGTYSSFGAHGDHVVGIITGSGALNPRHRGMAPEAEVITQKTSLITYYTEDYFTDYGMVLTNNSYGTTSNCDINGTYNYSSQSLDMQMRNYPEMLHIYAAGNNGWETCGDFPKSFHTVLRYYQAAKNVLTVGNVKDNRTINPNSSRGPVNDGRLKPEICGVGTNVMSTGRENNYWNASGTSMAAPAVVGTMALMYERYRELNGGANPEGALMKAIACNTAEDLGNKGPDFTYGFGLINALRAIKTIDSDNFDSGTVEHGRTTSHTVAIPSGVEQVKIMLYWHDKEGEAGSEKILVNDLDLTVTAPDNSIYLPWVLNTAAVSVEDDAQRGEDHLNNIEQVTINTPSAGLYSFDIKGYDVPFGPQKYHITYEFIGSEVSIIYPAGGESLDFDQAEKIRWDADPGNTNNFKVEWSADNGGTWETIADNLAADVREVEWTPSNSNISEEALVKVSKIGTSVYDQSDYVFSVLGVPADLTAESVCAGYVELNWTAQDYATAYEVLLFIGEEMVKIASVTENTYTVESGLELGEKYWFSVRALGAGGTASERTIAVECTPEIVTPCNWENDGLLSSGMETLRGRQKTASSLGTEETITVSIKNLGVNELQTIELYYQINNGTIVNETFNGSIPVGESQVYTFQQKADFSQPNEYSINAWMEIPGDTHPDNDFLSTPISAVQLGHGRMQLPYVEDFEELSMSDSFMESKIGPEGLLSWDLDMGEGSYAFTETGDGDEGVALTVGNTGLDFGVYKNQAILNLELSTMAGSSEEVYFIFSYKSNLGVFTLNSSLSENENTIYVRGSESDEWIKLMTLDIDKSWAKIPSIDLTRILTAAGQEYSSNTQIMFQQLGSVALIIDNVSLSTISRLPVTMDTFSARRTEEDAVLEWTTVSEVANDFFLIEMAEGVEGVMKGAFEVIGKVAGQGFSDEINNYSFVDTRKGKKGDRYYRLKQVDFGGNATDSDFRVVHFPVIDAELALYPNPFFDQVTVHYESESVQDVTVLVADGKGRVIKEYQEQFQKGRHELPLAIDDRLPGGLYSIQIVYADQVTQSFRISKVRD